LAGVILLLVLTTLLRNDFEDVIDRTIVPVETCHRQAGKRMDGSTIGALLATDAEKPCSPAVPLPNVAYSDSPRGIDFYDFNHRRSHDRGSRRGHAGA
jgi:hypothetical protein